MSSYQTFWDDELHKKFASNVSWTFLLHFNVVDFVRTPKGEYKHLKQYLVEDMLKRRQMVVFYDRSKGIHFFRPEMETCFIQLLGLKPPKGQEKVTLPRDPALALPLLEEFIKISPEEAAKKFPDHFKSDKPFGALIMGFSETFAPDGAINSQSTEDRTSIVTISRWARNVKIEESGNIIIMMTVNKEDVSKTIRTATSNIECIKVPLPNKDQRLDYIKHLTKDKRFKKLKLKIDSENFANHTSGLALVSIEDIIKRATHDKIKIDVDYIWKKKKMILENMGGGLIEIIKPRWGFNVIGNLEIVKNYLMLLSKSIRRGDFFSVPMGILLLGPPGTGKSVIVEAFAKEIGFALVKVKSLRDPYVGVSERRQEFVFHILEALAPVIVFEDEIEGKHMARGSYHSGDSGLTSRMSARRREFMGDTRHRGDIICIGATNRPDLMDEADLREGRYDVKIPFMIPKSAEVRANIFKAILRKMSIDGELQGKDLDYKISDSELLQLANKKQLKESTGAEIESICRRACEIRSFNEDGTLRNNHVAQAIKEFIPSRDDESYEFMQMLALQLTNFTSLIPEEYRKEAEKIRKKAEEIRKKKKEFAEEKCL